MKTFCLIRETFLFDTRNIFIGYFSDNSYLRSIDWLILLDFKRLIYCVAQTFYLSLQKFKLYIREVGWKLKIKPCVVKVEM